MRPARFQDFAVDALAKAPDVKSVDAWQEGSRPFGVHIMFMSGAQIWAAITATAAPAARGARNAGSSYSCSTRGGRSLDVVARSVSLL